MSKLTPQEWAKMVLENGKKLDHFKEWLPSVDSGKILMACSESGLSEAEILLLLKSNVRERLNKIFIKIVNGENQNWELRELIDRDLTPPAVEMGDK
jgi:hypothetical protein